MVRCLIPEQPTTGDPPFIYYGYYPYYYSAPQKTYEYKCPFCKLTNYRYSDCGRIVCDCCKKEFTT